jgi:hypothetical protein
MGNDADMSRNCPVPSYSPLTSKTPHKELPVSWHSTVKVKDTKLNRQVLIDHLGNERPCSFEIISLGA